MVTDTLPSARSDPLSEKSVGILSLISTELKSITLLTDDKMHGNSTRLCHRRFKLDIRKYFFTVSMVKRWNRLPSIQEAFGLCSQHVLTSGYS